MRFTIDREYLAEIFTTLCEISSPSRKEGPISNWLLDQFETLGASSIYIDNSSAKTGSESGNIIIRFDGNQPDKSGFFLSCHMDTVGPCENVRVVRTGDTFTSGGETILGADDKSGIAAIIGMISYLKEHELDHPMIEIVITTCEEIGLLGAKHLEYQKLQTPFGYALDSIGTNHVITGAPAANKITVEITGLASHAGLCPEAGINALSIAAIALSRLEIGRLDDESTCNFGLIEGGTATNIVPEKVVLRGEVRSHDPEKLAQYTKRIFDCFQQTVVEWPQRAGTDRPRADIKIVADYPAMALDSSMDVIRRLDSAAARIDRQLQYIVAGGGSDANIFNGYGLPTAIVASGMNKVHTIDEYLELDDLVGLTELLLALATVEE